MRTRSIVCVSALISIVCCLPLGCTPTQQTATTGAVQTQLNTTSQQLAAAQAAYEKQVDGAEKAKTLAQVQKLQNIVDQLTAALHASTNDDGTINIPAAASAAGAVLPPPWNLIAMIGLPLIVGAIQEVRKRQATADGTAALAAAANVATTGNTPGVTATDLATHEQAVMANLSDGATAMYNAMPDFKTASDAVSTT